MIEIDPLKTRSEPLFDWLDKHALAFREEVHSLGGRAEQSVRQGHYLIGRIDQTKQWARAGDHIELRSAGFGKVLQLHDIRSQCWRDADDPLAPQGKRNAHLLARDRQTANLQEGARNRVVSRYFGKR